MRGAVYKRSVRKCATTGTYAQLDISYPFFEITCSRPENNVSKSCMEYQGTISPLAGSTFSASLGADSDSDSRPDDEW
jgi:hypothetical protein